MKESWEKYFKTANLDNKIKNLISYAYSRNKIVYPLKDDVLRIFDLIDFNNVKVVIIGQDPYHQPNQANGIAFSVSDDVKTPPSLKNIYKELKYDLNIDHSFTNVLSNWVVQGVLLINSSWTVIESNPGSDSNLGWDKILETILIDLYKSNPSIVFCLWGNHAKKIYSNLNIESNYIIESGHPSPLSYRFFEKSKPFSKINNLLQAQNNIEIDWSK